MRKLKKITVVLLTALLLIGVPANFMGSNNILIAEARSCPYNALNVNF